MDYFELDPPETAGRTYSKKIVIRRRRPQRRRVFTGKRLKKAPIKKQPPSISNIIYNINQPLSPFSLGLDEKPLFGNVIQSTEKTGKKPAPVDIPVDIPVEKEPADIPPKKLASIEAPPKKLEIEAPPKKLEIEAPPKKLEIEAPPKVSPFPNVISLKDIQEAKLHPVKEKTEEEKKKEKEIEKEQKEEEKEIEKTRAIEFTIPKLSESRVQEIKEKYPASITNLLELPVKDVPAEYKNPDGILSLGMKLNQIETLYGKIPHLFFSANLSLLRGFSKQEAKIQTMDAYIKKVYTAMKKEAPEMTHASPHKLAKSGKSKYFEYSDFYERKKALLDIARLYGQGIKAKARGSTSRRGRGRKANY